MHIRDGSFFVQGSRWSQYTNRSPLLTGHCLILWFCIYATGRHSLEETITIVSERNKVTPKEIKSLASTGWCVLHIFRSFKHKIATTDFSTKTTQSVRTVRFASHARENPFPCMMSFMIVLTSGTCQSCLFFASSHVQSRTTYLSCLVDNVPGHIDRCDGERKKRKIVWTPSRLTSTDIPLTDFLTPLDSR